MAIARAVINRPTVLLADEPTGNLDSAATNEVLRLFDDLRANGQTLVIVTHDRRTAATADRIVSMRDGALVEDHVLAPSTAERGRHPLRWGTTVSRIRLGTRLAVRDLRRRSTETLLLLLALSVAATTLTIGLVLHGQTAAPYAVTRDRTAGPDVVALLFPAPGKTVTASDLTRLERRKCPPRRGGPQPSLPHHLGADRGRRHPRCLRRCRAATSRRRRSTAPRSSSGRWVGGRGVVVERAFAQALGVRRR